MSNARTDRRTYTTPRWKLLARTWWPTVVGVLAVFTMICGVLGFLLQYSQRDRENSVQDVSIPLYKAVQLFLLNSGAEDDKGHAGNLLLTSARVSASLLFLVVSSAVIWRVVDEMRALPRQLLQKDHVLICGLGQIGLQLLDDLCDRGRGRDVVVIERDPANAWLDYARARGASVVVGDAAKGDVLNEARVAHAEEAFVVGGDDGINLEVTTEIGLLLANRPQPRRKRLELHVSIYDVQLASALRPYCPSLHDTDALQVRVFNVPRSAAARVVTHELWPYAPRLRSEVAHYVIVGFGPVGQALAVQLAQLAHFPNGKRSRFTIADRDVQASARGFLSRFGRFTSWSDEAPGVAAFSPEADEWSYNAHPLPREIAAAEAPEAIQYAANAEFRELPGGRADERFARRIVELVSQPGVKPVVFICGERDFENFDAGAALCEHLSNLDRPDIPIFVWLPHQPALAEALLRKAKRTEGAAAGGRSDPETRVFLPFAEWRELTGYKEVTKPKREAIGRKLHEAYVRHAGGAGAAALADWEAIRDDFRESNRIAADHLFIKRAALFHERRVRGEAEFPAAISPERAAEEATMLAEMEHNRWVAERLLSGWRYSAPADTPERAAADKARKLSSALVPWENLGEERLKDFNLIAAALDDCREYFLDADRSARGRPR